MKVKSESEVAQSCPTLSDPMDCSLPGSSVHGIFQARVLEWGGHCLLRRRRAGLNKRGEKAPREEQAMQKGIVNQGVSATILLSKTAEGRDN